MTDIILSQTNGVVTADSREVAEHFGKQHKDVLASIYDIIRQTSAEISADLFFSSTYLDSYGREQRCYLMTRDGFTLLAMGFTGPKALEWKFAYIKAFNDLENRALKPMTLTELVCEQAKLMVETEKRLNKTEADVLQITGKIERIGNAIIPIHDGWQDEIESRIRSVCHRYALDYRDVHGQLYSTLEARAHCDLNRRVENKRERMAANGATVAAINGVTKISVIADDPDLRAHYERVVQDWIVRTEASA